jgi:hypothetical protein
MQQLLQSLCRLLCRPLSHSYGGASLTIYTESFCGPLSFSWREKCDWQGLKSRRRILCDLCGFAFHFFGRGDVNVEALKAQDWRCCVSHPARE